MSIVLRGVRPYGEEPADLVLDDGRIVAVSAPGRGAGDDIIDCDGTHRPARLRGLAYPPA